MKAIAEFRTRRLDHLEAPSKKVAIVVPLSSRPGLDQDERVSLRHLLRHLGHYDKYMLAPKGASADYPGFGVKHFDTRFFGSGAAHAALQMNPGFFETFIDYEYILMYHLDCLVFSDQLLQWCDRGWDYIGAPWMPGKETPWVSSPCVGNSGFALFNVRKCLSVLYSPRPTVDPMENWKQHWRTKAPLLDKLKYAPRAASRWLHSFNSVGKEINYWLERKRASDLFWSMHAAKYIPDFRVATPDDGFEFAFETEPRKCFEQLGHLPFGCHAFGKYDRTFWKPHMLGTADQPLPTESTDTGASLSKIGEYLRPHVAAAG